MCSLPSFAALWHHRADNYTHPSLIVTVERWPSWFKWMIVKSVVALWINLNNPSHQFTQVYSRFNFWSIICLMIVSFVDLYHHHRHHGHFLMSIKDTSQYSSITSEVKPFVETNYTLRSAFDSSTTYHSSFSSIFMSMILKFFGMRFQVTF